jgi:hypothetical protein
VEWPATKVLFERMMAVAGNVLGDLRHQSPHAAFAFRDGNAAGM